MSKSKWEHLFALTPKQKEVAAYLIQQNIIDLKRWSKELNITINNLHNYLCILKDKYDAFSNEDLLEKIKTKGLEIS